MVLQRISEYNADQLASFRALTESMDRLDEAELHGLDKGDADLSRVRHLTEQTRYKLASSGRVTEEVCDKAMSECLDKAIASDETKSVV